MRDKIRLVKIEKLLANNTNALFKKMIDGRGRSTLGTRETVEKRGDRGRGGGTRSQVFSRTKTMKEWYWTVSSGTG